MQGYNSLFEVMSIDDELSEVTFNGLPDILLKLILKNKAT